MLSTVNQVPVVRNAKHSNAENTFWDSHLKESSANLHEAFKEKSRPLCQQLADSRFLQCTFEKNKTYIIAERLVRSLLSNRKTLSTGLM